MNLFLSLLSGLLWTIVYIDSIRLGFKQKTYAMPLWALSLNFAWELLHSIFGFNRYGFETQNIVNVVWASFDVGILVTYFRFGHRYFPKEYKKGMFYIWSCFVILASVAVQLTFITEFTYLPNAATYSAYLQNVLMSGFFIGMLISRNSSIGQSKIIAYSKFIGTLAPTVLIGILGGERPFNGEASTFVLVLGILCAVLDVIYIILLTKKQNEEKPTIILSRDKKCDNY